jgi:EAL domain-containing protein (putative c-di-GMP-specific phosphodiesterase class I)
MEMVQNHIFIFGFSLLSISHDEMTVSFYSSNADVGLVVEALLLFFSSNNCFGRYLPIMPVLSILEVVFSSGDARDLTSVISKSKNFPMRLAPPRFTNEWRAGYESEMNFCQRLVSVLEEGKCSLSLQPIYDMSGKNLLCSEALLRFAYCRGKIDTQRAINAFESTGLIRLIDRYVLNAVIDRLKSNPNVNIACNVSALSFSLDFWWESALRDLRKYPSVARRLIIELTEGAIVEDYATFLKFANSLKSLGVRFSLDDFGVGMPRVAALNSFAFDYIKLDKSMIRNLNCSSMRFQMISNAVMCFQEMGAQVIAEGIEHEQDIMVARKLGCSYMQGYHLGPPSSKNKISINAVGVNEYSAFGLSV